MFPSHYLTFGTGKYTQLKKKKKSFTHICLIIHNMVSKEILEKAN